MLVDRSCKPFATPAEARPATLVDANLIMLKQSRTRLLLGDLYFEKAGRVGAKLRQRLGQESQERCRGS
jgi:hypothetical protein